MLLRVMELGRLIRNYRRDPYLASATVGAGALVLLGVLVLVGWTFEIEVLKTALPGKLSMKYLTALGFTFSGAALLLILLCSSSRARWSAGVFAALVFAIGIASLLEYTLNKNFGIDQQLFRDPIQSLYPGLIAHITAINFCLAGSSIALLALAPRAARWSQGLAALAGLGAILAIVCCAYRMPLLYGSLQYPSMSFHTGAGFLVLFISILCCQPYQGFMRFITSPHPGGWLSRRLLPASILVPTLIGAGFLQFRPVIGNDVLVIAAIVTTNSLGFVLLICFLAYHLNQLAEEDVAVKNALAASEAMLRQSQKMEAMGRLAGGVAHDFNNLIGIITGYSSLLLETTPTEDPDRSNIESIKRAGDSAAALTRQLLAFSRKQILQPTALELNSVVSAVNKMLRRLIPANISLDLHLAPEVGMIHADPGQVEQIIVNLVTNACDAMPEGGNLRIATSSIDVDTCGGDKTIREILLTVSDTGIGMDADTQRRIFEPFFTTKALGKGTGLGLATAYGIVVQSGGRIEVESTLGQGTSFRLYFPAFKDKLGGSCKPPKNSARIRN